MCRIAQTNLQLYGQLQAAGYPAEALGRVRAGYELASVLFAAQYRPNGKPFVCHLVGTASVLARHGAAPALVLAGLLHAAYAEGNFGTLRRGANARKRRALSAAIGAEAEALVARYSAFAWSAEVAARLVPRIGGLDDAERAVVLLRIANELEEAAAGDILFEPARRRAGKSKCLPHCSRLAEALERPELARELAEAFDAIPAARVPEELVSARAASYLEPPLSHRARLGPRVRQALAALARRAPPRLRARLRR